MEDITVEELKKRLDANEDLLVIDVRETYEFEEFNIGAKNIPLADFLGSLDDFEEQKDDEIVIHCRSGKRSAVAKQMMGQVGFSKVRNLLGGMLDWQAKF